MGSGHQIEPVTALVGLLALVLGPAVANIIGPYAVIILSSLIGGGWALGRRTAEQRGGLGKALVFLLLVVGSASMLTAGLAELVNRYVGLTTSNWLLAPIALLIGGVGQDWPKIGLWVIRRLARVVDNRIDRFDPAGADERRAGAERRRVARQEASDRRTQEQER